MDFLYITSPLFFDHLTGDHPENPKRLDSINAEVAKIIPQNKWLEPRDATTQEISTIHTLEYIAGIKEACEKGLSALDPDTPISQMSYLVAIRAAGAGCTAIDKICDGKIKRAFCGVRPPGHHAEKERAMGFCLFNNIAITAEYAKQKGFHKIAIVDFDVHHGNGTEHSFYNDPSVLFISFHHWGIYPGTGRANDRGGESAMGANINYPLSPMSGDDEYLSIVRASLEPKLLKFSPDILLISAGFDAHETDPLGGMALTDNGFRVITQHLVDFAEENCDGKVVSFLEGGYNLTTLGKTVSEHIKILKG